MARVKLTEHKTKRLILGEKYRGVSFGVGDTIRLPARGRYVVKVDEGIKKRMKRGLVALDVPARGVIAATAPWRKYGFMRFLAESMVPHKPEDERYISLERVRDGIRALYARKGGVDIEAHPEAVERHLIAHDADMVGFCKNTKIPEAFVRCLLEVFEKNFFAFLEINPLVIKNGTVHLLDAAALVDSAGSFFVRDWTESDIVKGKVGHKAEAHIEALAATTPASLKLNVVNKNGSLFFLLSGGGGSIVIADEAKLKGLGKEIGNYGEYSGGPTREETYLYAKEILGLLLASKAKKKALVIAGGVANFTDIKTTFAGVIDALGEVAVKLRAQKIKVFVRRGGPHEKEGLAHMEEFLRREKLFGSVHSSQDVITAAVDDAVGFVKRS